MPFGSVAKNRPISPLDGCKMVKPGERPNGLRSFGRSPGTGTGAQATRPADRHDYTPSPGMSL